VARAPLCAAVWCVLLVARAPLCAAVWRVQLVAGAPLCAAVWCVQLVAGTPLCARECDPRCLAHDVSRQLLNGVKRALVSLGVIIVLTACLRGVAEQRTLQPESCRRPVVCPFMSPCSETLLPFCIAENSEGKHVLTCQSRLLYCELYVDIGKEQQFIPTGYWLLLVQLVKFALLSLPSFLSSGFKMCTNNLTCRK
jgi:hypothetical protein